MKDGYYWAKNKNWGEDADWDIVQVHTYHYSGGRIDPRQDVYELGSDVYCEIDEFEFGDRIEIPKRYRKE